MHHNNAAKTLFDIEAVSGLSRMRLDRDDLG